MLLFCAVNFFKSPYRTACFRNRIFDNMLLKNSILFFLLALFYITQAQSVVRLDGSKISSSALDQKIQQLMDSGRVTGLAIAVFNHNKPVYEKTFGYKNAVTKEGIKPTT